MQNLEHLVAGDQVATQSTSSSWGNTPRISHNLHTIERVTATQITCTHGLRVRRSDGKVIGDQRSSAYAIHATERLVAENTAQKAAQMEHYQLSARVNRMTSALGRSQVSPAALAELVEVYERHYPAV